MLACAVFDFGSDDGRISCLSPWQSAHFAPRATPDFTAFAWRLLSHAATESGWQEAQSTALGAGSCGYAFTSAWQFVQSSGPWTDAAIFLGSTCCGRSGLSWQARHSAFVICARAEIAASTNAAAMISFRIERNLGHTIGFA